MFDKNNIPIDVLQKYFKVITNMKDLQTTNNICYCNYRKKYINTYLFDKYQSAYKTTRYINILDELVENYNNSCHSGIQGYQINQMNIN